MDSFKTISAVSKAIYKEKGSKFLAFAYPVNDEMAVKEILTTLKKEYFDAQHHCFAWSLGVDKKTRAFDDGEPNHSAGDPILGQIRSRELTDILVVVVRYFGGTKLGVSGLIAAYRAAAELALNEAKVIVREILEDVTIIFPYSTTPEVSRIIKEFQMSILHQEFGDESKMTLQYPIRNKALIVERLAVMEAKGIISILR